MSQVYKSCVARKLLPVKVTTNSNDIVSQLYQNKQKQFLTDKSLVFHGQSYPCHSSFLSSFSPVLKEKLLSSDHEVNFPQLESIVPDPDLFFQILDYCYGQPFQLTLQNLANVLSVASSLQLSSLVDAIYKIISGGFSKPTHLQLKSEEVLHTIKTSVERDVMLSYKSKSLTISSLVLICCSEYFKYLFCLNFADSNERKFSYVEQFSGVSQSNFETFFNYLLVKQLVLMSTMSLIFYQLAVYFQVKNLKQACNSFVSCFHSITDILFLLKTISERNLLNMLKDNLNLFGKLNKDLDLPSPFPLPLSFILLLMTKVTNSWLLKCLTVSITNQVFDEECHTLSQVFEKILVSDKIIQQVYNCLLPLFDQNYVHQFLFTWSMKVFQGVQNVQVIPDQWFLWCLSQSCMNFKRWKISNFNFFIQNFSLIIEECVLASVSITVCLAPEIFSKLKKILSPVYDLFLINCLVMSWKETELWSVNEFHKVIVDFDFGPSANVFQILNSLSDLTSDTKLAPSLTVDLLKHSLTALQHYHQKVNVMEQQFLLLNSELKSLKQSNMPLIEKHKALIGTFDSNFCGSKLYLSNTNTVVTKTDSGSNDSSFVAVNLSDFHSVKFTRLDDLQDLEPSGCDDLGWKTISILQDACDSCPHIAHKGFGKGLFYPFDPSFPKITKDESITVSFSNGKAYFKPSTSTTTFSIDIPINLVFGLTVWGQNHEWKVELTTSVTKCPFQCNKPDQRGTRNCQSISTQSHSKAEISRSAYAYDFQEQRNKAKQDHLFATLKVTTGLLNKLSESNKVKLFSSIVEIFKRQHPFSKCFSNELLAHFKIEFVNLLFDKAVLEPSFVNLYSQLCLTLTKLFPGFAHILVTQCQTYFEQFFLKGIQIGEDDLLERDLYVNYGEVTEAQFDAERFYRKTS
ncbi:hypothetical protein GEMRC1_012695 [Eukaryota sp. GEM-RC1]